jgi:transposase
MRKGKIYGTIIVDLNTRRPIELLPERSASCVTAWLVKHSEIELISRDRSNEYIKAATDGT